LSAHFLGKYTTHPNKKKSQLIVALQKIAGESKLDKPHYMKMTIEQLYNECQQAQEAEIGECDYEFVFWKKS
jgi:hypothetical protein